MRLPSPSLEAGTCYCPRFMNTMRVAIFSVAPHQGTHVHARPCNIRLLTGSDAPLTGSYSSTPVAMRSRS